MTLKKILSVMTAVMLSLVGLSSISVSATGIEYQAFISGVLGEAHENQAWHIGELQAGCEVITVDGDGTYDVNWTIDVGPTNKTEFLMLVLPGLSANSYPNLSITIDEFRVDGAAYDYTQSANSCDLYYINGTAEARVYFIDKWAGSGVQDIPVELSVQQSVGVTFTISGFGVQGSGNSGSGDSGSDEPATTTTAATTTTTAVTTTTTFAQSVKEEATTTTVAEKTESKSEAETTSASSSSTEEDDGGPKTWMILIGVGAALVIAAVIVVIVKIRNKRYYL